MPIVVQTNVGSLQAQKNIAASQNSLATSFNRLSSGYRINSAKDDAAGLAISESFRSQIRSYAVAERNANDGASMAQTAEGALGEVSGIMHRMRELAVQGANGSLQETDRDYIQTEFTAMQSEVARILTSTKFNGQQLINADEAELNFQVGINNVDDDKITVTFGGIDLSDLTDSAAVAGDGSESKDALDTIDAALTTVSTARARFGAVMSRLEVTTSNIATVRTNIAAANSRIRDVDVAMEAGELSRTQVLSQGGASILAQANQSPQMALSLLR